MNLFVQSYPVRTNYPTFKSSSHRTDRPADLVEITDADNYTASNALRNYLLLKEYGQDDKANDVLEKAVDDFGNREIRRALTNVGSDLHQQGEARTERALVTAVLKATGDIKKSDLPEEFIPVKKTVENLRENLDTLKKSKSDDDAIETVQNQLDRNILKVKREIKSLQKQLKAYGAGTDRYDQIHMDRIQAKIKALREIVPIDRTNLKEVLLASPDEVFAPIKADNIKGLGISFRPVVPSDPEALKTVTYRAVPIYTQARTVEEMIRLAKRDGIKIELVQDEKGNYYPGVKNIWSEGGYFKLDRDSYVLKYGEIPADDPYIDKAWAEKNKYKNKDGKYVIMDCAIVAADKKTMADIMPNSYVKGNGHPLTRSDKYAWNGFDAHKDPNGVINAVAYDSPRVFNTLEGPIETDVTMGDVEGNVYNKYRDLEKQILKNKIQANPDDPNSQTFIDLVKSGDKDAALELLRKATAESSKEN